MKRKIYTAKEEFLEQNEALQTGLPFSEDTSVLAQPLQVGSHRIPNRLACQAMEGCDGTATGEPGELTMRRYGRFARGGAGLLWFEATAVLEEGRANPRQLYITPGNVDAFKSAVETIKEEGIKANGKEPVLIMQATHSGRYSKPTGMPAPLIAYNNPVLEGDTPLSQDRIVTDDYLDLVKEKLVEGARLAEQAGFDGVDIKCCHRYLNSELLSAYHRPGRYGGSLENRTRLLREAVQGALQSCGKDFLVSSRLNVYDGYPYPYGFGVGESGTDFDPTEPIWLLKQLQSYGVKLLNITMGNPYNNPHVNRPFVMGGYTPEEHPLSGVARMLLGTAELKKAVPDLKILCSALSYLGVAAPHVTAALIQEGSIDLAGFGRQTFAYPDFAKDIMQGGMQKDKLCICCSKCTQVMRAGSTPGCVIRDKEVYGPLYQQYCGGK